MWWAGVKLVGIWFIFIRIDDVRTDGSLAEKLDVRFEEALRFILALFDNSSLKCPANLGKEVNSCIESIKWPLKNPDVCRIVGRVYDCIEGGFEKCGGITRAVGDTVFRSTLNKIVQQKGCLKLRPVFPRRTTTAEPAQTQRIDDNSSWEQIKFVQKSPASRKRPLLGALSVSLILFCLPRLSL